MTNCIDTSLKPQHPFHPFRASTAPSTHTGDITCPKFQTLGLKLISTVFETKLKMTHRHPNLLRFIDIIRKIEKTEKIKLHRLSLVLPVHNENVSTENKFKFFIALSFTTYQHYTTYNINNNIHIYRVMYMMMVESD